MFSLLFSDIVIEVILRAKMFFFVHFKVNIFVRLVVNVTMLVCGESHLQQGSVLVPLRSWRGWDCHVPSVGSAPCGG